MVSLRCKVVVREKFRKIGISPVRVELGLVELSDPIQNELLDAIESSLRDVGLELLRNQKSILVENIKNLIIDMIHFSEGPLPKVKHSVYLSEKLGYKYNYLSNVFSEVKGMTIHQYIVKHKIEKAKELLFYNELNLTEIAYKLNYSSVAHLSNQFKKVTGVRPSYYKNRKNIPRLQLEDL